MSWGNNGNLNSNSSLLAHISEFVGETVTIFTKSGGISGCGFTGVVLSVNCDFVRLVTHQGTAPTNPIGGPNSSCCRDLYNNGFDNGCDNQCHGNRQQYSVGSVCDIPICKIAAFCHNAI